VIELPNENFAEFCITFFIPVNIFVDRLIYCSYHIIIYGLKLQ